LIFAVSFPQLLLEARKNDEGKSRLREEKGNRRTHQCFTRASTVISQGAPAIVCQVVAVAAAAFAAAGGAATHAKVPLTDRNLSKGNLVVNNEWMLTL